MTVVPGRPWRRAAGWLLLLGPFFFLSYGAATFVTTLRDHVGSVVFAWERQIPFVPWTIIPYWSIDVLYGISLFLCTTERELGVHVRRLLTAQVVAVSCFILAPLRFTFARPPVDGVAGALFDALSRFDKPFNQAPSLHIALLVILWDRFARHTSARARWILHGWFALIGLSVLTTWQHHFFDLPTGALLGFACLWAWPECAPSPLATAHLTRDRRRWLLAGFYTAGSAALVAFAAMASGGWFWLLWPAVSLGLVAGNYALFGAAGFQKAGDGQMSLAVRILLAPYIAAAWINSRLWTRAEPAWVSIGDGVLLGRIPSRGTMTAWATTLDLCAELPRPRGVAAYHAVPMLDLVAPAPEQLRLAAETIERHRAAGPLLVCCALGYGRSAAAVVAWLLLTGRASDIDAAIWEVRQARRRIVLNGETRGAIVAAACVRQ